MANNIKRRGGALSLQVTRPARKAGLVLEDTDDNPTRLADVYVYGFDDLLLVIDYEMFSDSQRTNLVVSAAKDSGSIYQGIKVSVREGGRGYQVQVPGAEDAGFPLGEEAPVKSTQGVLVVYKDNETERLANDLITQGGAMGE